MTTSTIEATIVSGTIKPKEHIYRPCGTENNPLPPSVSVTTASIPIPVLKELTEQYDKWQTVEHSFNWKQRLIFKASTSDRILSVAFIPAKLSESSILFVQKWGGENVGYYAPYLAQADREKYHATSELDFQEICPETIHKTIHDFDEDLKEQLKACLQYFLKDETSDGIALTYKDGSGQWKTQGWRKLRHVHIDTDSQETSSDSDRSGESNRRVRSIAHSQLNNIEDPISSKKARVSEDP